MTASEAEASTTPYGGGAARLPSCGGGCSTSAPPSATNSSIAPCSGLPRPPLVRRAAVTAAAGEEEPRGGCRERGDVRRARVGAAAAGDSLPLLAGVPMSGGRPRPSSRLAEEMRPSSSVAAVRWTREASASESVRRAACGSVAAGEVVVGVGPTGSENWMTEVWPKTTPAPAAPAAPPRRAACVVCARRGRWTGARGSCGVVGRWTSSPASDGARYTDCGLVSVGRDAEGGMATGRVAAAAAAAAAAVARARSAPAPAPASSSQLAAARSRSRSPPHQAPQTAAAASPLRPAAAAGVPWRGTTPY
eukprot:scaffold22324_cov46-Phaeocystis_antarctica.AAC.1